MRTWYKKGQALLDEIAAARPGEGELYAWYIGQVGFVLKAEKVVCIDPFLNDLVEDGASLRLYEAPFALDALAPNYVLCTHGHGDHMALPTLTAIAARHKGTLFLVPGGCVDALAAAGVEEKRIIPMKAGETVSLPGLTVRPVQAAHPVHETDAQGRDLALCLSVRMGGVEALHMGDTYLTDQLLADVRALPRPDVFFTPINGGDYFRTARNCIGNMNSLESARLASVLGARLSVPTHFDLIRGNTCDPLAFVQHLWNEDPAACFRIPALGEKLVVRA